MGGTLTQVVRQEKPDELTNKARASAQKESFTSTHQMDEDDPVPFISALQKATGWSADPILDISKRMSSSFTVIVFKANSLAAVRLNDVWEAFYTAALDFNKEFGVVPVVIIDNANRLAVKQRELLETRQKSRRPFYCHVCICSFGGKGAA